MAGARSVMADGMSLSDGEESIRRWVPWSEKGRKKQILKLFKRVILMNGR